MTINIMILTMSKANGLPSTIRSSMIFYAPLTDHLDFYGIEPVTFTRTGSSTVKFRDGGTHTVATGVPRFEYNTDHTYRGLLLDTGETLTYSTGNKLNDSNTLIWFEDGVAKSTPTNTNPFTAGGAWNGGLPVRLRQIAKFSRTLTAGEIAIAQSVLGG